MAILLGFVIMAVSIVQFMVIKKWKDRRDEDARKQTRKRIAFILLAIVCVIWIFPLIWAIFTSFKSEAEIQKVGFSLIPQDWTLANFLGLLQGNDSSPVFRWFVNSMIISTSHTLLVMVIVSFAAYGYTTHL